MSTPPPNMSTPPQEPDPTTAPLPIAPPSIARFAPPPTAPPPTAPPPGAVQTVFSMLSQSSSSRENQSEPSTSTAILGTAQSVLSRLVPSSAPNPASTPASPLLSEVPQDHTGEAPVPTDASVRVIEPTIIQAPTSITSPGGTGGRAITPPRGSSRVTRSYPAFPEATYTRPISTAFGTARRSAGAFPDSETLWHASDERDPPRERTVGERIQPTIESATMELFKAELRAKYTNWAQNIAISLQVFVGALTTALGAALSGKNTSVAISILGGTSTLIASFLARTKGSNEPQMSFLRAQALEHFVREIEAFKLDHGHEIGHTFDEKIHGFRLGLEKILGNQPGSVAVRPNGVTGGPPGQEKVTGGTDFNPGYGGSGPGGYSVGAMKAKSDLV